MPTIKSFKDVKPGDVVQLGLNDLASYTVRSVKVVEYGHIDLDLHHPVKEFCQQFYVSPEDHIALLHRSWPEGKTERGMLHEISVEAYAFNEAAEAGDAEKARVMARRLLEVIEAYELGRPLEDAKGDTSKENGGSLDGPTEGWM